MGSLLSITMRWVVQLLEVRGEGRIPYLNLTYLVREEWRICNRCQCNTETIRELCIHHFINTKLSFYTFSENLRKATLSFIVSCSPALRGKQSNTGLLNLFCSVGDFAKIFSAREQHGIQYTEWRMNKFAYNYRYNFNCVFFYTSCAVKKYR